VKDRTCAHRKTLISQWASLASRRLKISLKKHVSEAVERIKLGDKSGIPTNYDKRWGKEYEQALRSYVAKAAIQGYGTDGEAPHLEKVTKFVQDESRRIAHIIAASIEDEYHWAFPPGIFHTSRKTRLEQMRHEMHAWCVYYARDVSHGLCSWAFNCGLVYKYRDEGFREIEWYSPEDVIRPANLLHQKRVLIGDYFVEPGAVLKWSEENEWESIQVKRRVLHPPLRVGDDSTIYPVPE